VNRSVGFVVSGRSAAATNKKLQSTALAGFMQLLLLSPFRLSSYQYLRNFFAESCVEEVGKSDLMKNSSLALFYSRFFIFMPSLQERRLSLTQATTHCIAALYGTPGIALTRRRRRV
jgi:hypothetical protein